MICQIVDQGLEPKVAGESVALVQNKSDRPGGLSDTLLTFRLLTLTPAGVYYTV